MKPFKQLEQIKEIQFPEIATCFCIHTQTKLSESPLHTHMHSGRLFKCIILFIKIVLRHHRFNVRIFALSRVKRFPQMPFLRTARSCISSCISLNCLMSPAVRSFHVFLTLPLPLSPELPCFYTLTHSHMHLYAPQAQTILISLDALCRTSSLFPLYS
jgi:hypothetical protein